MCNTGKCYVLLVSFENCFQFNEGSVSRKNPWGNCFSSDVRRSLASMRNTTFLVRNRNQRNSSVLLVLTPLIRSENSRFVF